MTWPGLSSIASRRRDWQPGGFTPIRWRCGDRCGTNWIPVSSMGFSLLEFSRLDVPAAAAVKRPPPGREKAKALVLAFVPNNGENEAPDRPARELRGAWLAWLSTHRSFQREEDSHVSTILVPQCGGLGPPGSAGGSWPTARPTLLRECSSPVPAGLSQRLPARVGQWVPPPLPPWVR